MAGRDGPLKLVAVARNTALHFPQRTRPPVRRSAGGAIWRHSGHGKGVRSAAGSGPLGGAAGGAAVGPSSARVRISAALASTASALAADSASGADVESASALE